MGHAPEKPRKGQTCNGCGFCCAAERCPIAIILIGEGPGPCPAMEFEGGRFWCGFLRNASRYTTAVPAGFDDVFAASLMDYFGTGCDSEDPETARM